ncbi:unnamed protein product [Chrysoparadoxa australica]
MPRAEGKEDSDDGKAGDSEDESTPVLDLLDLEVTPNHCDVSERLELSMDFKLSSPLSNAYWEIKLVVDSVSARHTIVLGSTEPQDYPKGKSSMYFHVQSIDVSGVEPCALANTGLVTAGLKAGKGDEIADVNMVVQVEENNGRFSRTIYSPLE